MSEEERELLEFIGFGGATLAQLEERYGTTEPPALASLEAKGLVVRKSIVLRETSATGVGGHDEIPTVQLTDQGKLALQ